MIIDVVYAKIGDMLVASLVCRRAFCFLNVAVTCILLLFRAVRVDIYIYIYIYIDWLFVIWGLLL